MDDVMLAELDRDLQAAARPSDDSVRRVRERIQMRLEDDPRKESPQAPAQTHPVLRVDDGGRRAPFWAVTFAAAACLIAGLLGGVLIAPRLSGGTGGGVASVISAPQPGGQPAVTPPGQGVGAGGGAAGGGFPGTPVNSCATMPSVSVAGRALGATGVGHVAPGPGGVSGTLFINLNETGPDAAGTAAALQARITNLQSVLEANGVAKGDSRVSSFSLSSQLKGPGVSAWQGFATVQATVPADQMPKAAAEVVKAPGVSGYATGTVLTGEPSPEAVQTAIAAATAQARAAASSTAKAAGVTLGPLENVVTFPPTLCGYGSQGPDRIVQVSLTYALK
jgi:uncharacterized protein YggE/ElaB/YqjD/DUF883 family membrane-anchored ribosome-binding protein